MFAMAPSATKYIWQHSDLSQDMKNVTKRSVIKNGVKLAEVNFENLGKIYRFYDKVISVSEALMTVNKKNMANELTADKFDFVCNPINISRIKNCLTQIDAPKVPDCQKSAHKFITVGRLSAEKNHLNLVKGFSKFHKEHPDSYLYIVGPRQFADYAAQLEALIESLSLQGNVILIGQISNPFVLMSGCDCFILPSHYEGLSVTVLEARYIGLPIIISNYSTVDSACIPDGQLIIGMGVEDIYGGMVEFKKGNVPKYKFDAEKYNAECFRQFEGLFRNIHQNPVAPGKTTFLKNIPR
jgi:glycosyltransferase involved in cell wall biosynthesis